LIPIFVLSLVINSELPTHYCGNEIIMNDSQMNIVGRNECKWSKTWQ